MRPCPTSGPISALLPGLPVATGLMGVAVALITYAGIVALMPGERRATKRLKSIAVTNVAATGRGGGVNRRDQVAKTLSEIEAKAKGAAKVTLELKIARAGLDWTKKTYWTFAGIAGFVSAFFLFLLTDSVFAALGGAFFGACGLPPFLLRWLRLRRVAKFNKELPNAVDVVVRGIKTGIPVGDCFRMVSREAEEPLRGEFRTIVETQALGLSSARPWPGCTSGCPPPR